MNKYFSILFLCSGIALHAQNPPEKKLASANKIYTVLTSDEQAYCDLMYRDLAIHHAQELHADGREQLIPEEINRHEDVAALGHKKAELGQKLNLSGPQLVILCNISLTRMAALWKQHAAMLGKNSTWPFIYEDHAEGLDYLQVKNSENEAFS